MICKLCFKEFHVNSFNHLFNKKTYICNQCKNKIVPRFNIFKIDGVKCFSIYDYDDFFKSLIYQFKGCKDIELAPIFLYDYRLFLQFKYLGYHMVLVPSYYQDDIDRGFNHVNEIFKFIKLKKLNILTKTSHIKQSDGTIQQREKIGDHLAIDKNVDLTNKRILLVDDISTSGNTLKACIKLLKEHNAKKIQCLVICKVKSMDDK